MNVSAGEIARSCSLVISDDSSRMAIKELNALIDSLSVSYNANNYVNFHDIARICNRIVYRSLFPILIAVSIYIHIRHNPVHNGTGRVHKAPGRFAQTASRLIGLMRETEEA